VARQPETKKTRRAAPGPTAARAGSKGSRGKAKSTPAAPSSIALARRAPEQALQPLRRTRLDDDLAKAFELAKHSQATSTRDAYKSDREHWTVYATECGIPVFPISAQHLAAYVVSMDEAKFSVSTIRRRCAALGRWHRDEGQPSPTANVAFREVIRGLLRQRHAAPTKKLAMSGEMVGRALVDPSFSLRDRVVLAVGFATGVRRSELVALRWSDLVEHPDGYAVRIGQSKTDKTGRGQHVAIRRHADAELCPVVLLQRWRDDQGVDDRSRDVIFGICDRTVAEIVKRAVELSGADPKLYSAHSLRSGMITAAGHDPSVPQAMTQKAARHVRGDQTLDYLTVHNTVTNPAFGASVNAIRRKKS